MLGSAEERPSVLIMENRSSLLIRATGFYHSTNADQHKLVMPGAANRWLIRWVDKNLWGPCDFTLDSLLKVKRNIVQVRSFGEIYGEIYQFLAPLWCSS